MFPMIQMFVLISICHSLSLVFDNEIALICEPIQFNIPFFCKSKVFRTHKLCKVNFYGKSYLKWFGCVYVEM